MYWKLQKIVTEKPSECYVFVQSELPEKIMGSVLKRTFMMLYSSDFEGNDDNCPYRRGKTLSSERRAFTLLSSVCFYWSQTLSPSLQSQSGRSLRNQLKKMIERECSLQT